MTSINCVWFCLLLCHSCNIFGLLRLEQQQQHQLVEALPFEYFEEHDDDFNYDLDEAQSQAKYDARLLSEQMLSDAELQQRADISYNSNLNANSNSKVNVDANTNLNGNSGLQPAENRGEQTAAGFVDSSAAEDDLEPHSRAAACFTNGHKYTHGQKVPRLDACEVCLCMDGEIFCWWEKCDKTNVNSAPTGDAGGGGEGDYSDPYRHETTTRKSTKLHKAERKVGKRHKHHKNQKNFNDYEVYHSRQQQQQQQQQQEQAKDYKKPDIKQQKQKSSTINSSSSSNYNIIKQHQHEQQPKLATSTSQQQQQQQQQKQQQPKSQPQLHVATAAAVNQAAKETHYQHQLPAPQQHEQHEQQQQQQTHQQHEHEQQQHLHAHQPHSSSKILNFPENLPALLYYDYKTEEHEHHQHQHHQQHLLHEKQRQQQQQQQQKQQLKRQQQQQLQKANRDVELATDLGSDKNFDEAETDSDILPEPPTKRPTKPTATTTTALTTGSSNIDNNSNGNSHSNSNSSNDSSNSNSRATTIAVATTIEMMTTPRSEHAVTVLAMANTNTNTNQQQQHRVEEIEDTDDAFHRWLTSTELNVDSTNTLDDNLPAVVVEQETPASTIIDDVGVNSSSSSISTSNSNGGSNRIAVNPKDNGNRHGNNIADNADAVFFRSSYNDYSSEFNGSVVNIDITLTAVDVHPQRPHQQQQQQQQPKAAAIGQTDLIANDNQTSDVHAAERQPTMEPAAAAAATTTTLLPHVAISSSSSSSGSSNQHSVPPYTLTTIITTTPLATGRMCNVLGKLYKIGEILPQDTGNCLQCICTDAVTPDELPSVTCSPHNCPPLVLPDLFDATGY